MVANRLRVVTKNIASTFPLVQPFFHFFTVWPFFYFFTAQPFLKSQPPIGSPPCFSQNRPPTRLIVWGKPREVLNFFITISSWIWAQNFFYTSTILHLDRFYILTILHFDRFYISTVVQFYHQTPNRRPSTIVYYRYIFKYRYFARCIFWVTTNFVSVPLITIR